MPSLDGQQVPAAPPAPKGAGPVAAGSAAKPPAPTPKPAVAAASTPAPGNALRFETTGSGFSNSKSAAIEVGENAHDPELDEAAIRFANGDDQGAEAGLLDRLGNGDDPSTSVEKWLTLFDLYRATGQQERFDIAAIDFANQFQRSAPQWFSMPFMVSELAAAQPAPIQMLAAHWSCPPLLNAKSVGVLADVIGRTLPPWRLTKSAAGAGNRALRSTCGSRRPREAIATQASRPSRSSLSGRSTAACWWRTRQALMRPASVRGAALASSKAG